VRIVRFLFEKRAEAYNLYVEGASEKKIVLDAKKPAESDASHLSRLAGRNKSAVVAGTADNSAILAAF
jgi:hypothetical protein